MPDNDDTVYNELVGFLKSDRQDLRAAACDAVLAVTDRDGMDKLIKHGAVQPLCRLISTPGKIGLNSIKALVNLTSIPISASQCVEDCIDCGAIRRSSEIALSFESDSTVTNKTDSTSGVRYALSLLSNITRSERGCVQLLGKSPDLDRGDDGDSRPTISLLVAKFLENEASSNVYAECERDGRLTLLEEWSEEGNLNDLFQYVASILMNVTQIDSGRKFLMRMRRTGKESKANENKDGARKGEMSFASSWLQAILPQLRSPNRVRRRGVAGAVKNCCFDSNSAWWLLHEVNLVKHLLYPLAGPEELDLEDKVGLDPELWLEGPDKIREPAADIRLSLVESLLLLCATGRKSREFLRTQRVYVIIKMADMVEENEEVGEKMNECVQFLKRDEEGTEEGSSDKMVEDTWRLRRPLLSSTTVAHGVSGDDFDAVD